MFKKGKKSTAIALAITMLFSGIQIPASAEEYVGDTELITETADEDLIIDGTDIEDPEADEDVLVIPEEEIILNEDEVSEEEQFIENDAAFEEDVYDGEEEEPLQFVMDSAVYVNPVYRDLVSERDIIDWSEEETAGLFSLNDSENSDIPYASSVEEAGALIRSAMVQRQGEISLKYQIQKSDYVDGWLNSWLPESMAVSVEHTGNPKEGDYLEFQYAGCGVDTVGAYSPITSCYNFTITVKLMYYTGEEEERYVDEQVSQLVSILGLKEQKSDMEKILGIYQYICENVSYDYDNLNNTEDKLKFTAYGALERKKAVCQGYANLFYRLCLEAGIDARIICGIGNGGPHAWNIVKNGDCYYCVDATWDAANYSMYQSFYYFMRAQDTFEDHTNDEKYNSAAFKNAYPISLEDFYCLGVSEHEWGDWKVTEAATCEKEGTETRTCAVCGKTETRPIEKAEHEWSDWKVTEAATCEKEGTETRTCAACGKTETRPIEKTEHEWSDWKVTEAATCEKEGTETRTCAVCGKTETRPIEKTEHEWGDWKVTEAATCEKEGTETRTCAVCGKTETRPIEKTEHEWGDWKVTEAATCEKEGTETRTCAVCGKTETRPIDKVPHTYSSEYTIDKQPTCTESGIKSRHCTINGCTAVTDEQELPALGHTWGKWEELKPATCAEEGTETRICAVCGKTETRPIDKVPHTYSSEYTIDKQPTCTESGIKSRHCTINGCTAVTDEQELPALGHTWGKWEELKPATCAEEGTETRTCAACGKTETRPIGKVPHTYSSEYTIDKQPTCTESGIKSRHCTTNGCTAITDTQVIPALGHDMGSWTVTSPATVLAEGVETRTCSRGDAQETRAIPKLPAKISVTANSLPMKTGQSTNAFKVTEMAAGDYLASVVSADTKIVKVSGISRNGTFKLTAQKKTGSTKLTIKLASGATKVVTVKVQKSKVKTTSVKASTRNVTVKKGKTVAVTAVALPVTTADKIKFSTSNKKIATVTSKGVIKGVKPGTAKITIKAGSKKVTVTVKVVG